MKKLSKEEYRALPGYKKAVYLVRTRWGDVLLGAWLLFLLGSWIWQDYVMPQPDVVVEMINGQELPQTRQAEENRMLCRSMPAPEPTQKLEINMDIQTDDPTSPDPGKLLFCRIQERRTDIYVWDDPMLGYTLRRQGLMDLRKVLPAELLEQYGDVLIYSDLELNGGYPCGIYLEENPWLQGSGYYAQGAALGVSRSCRDTQAAGQFLEEILQMW